MSDTEDKPLQEGNAVRTGKVVWDDSKMATSYANVCNATSNREEVSVFFGTNQTWHMGSEEIAIGLSHRIILNPHAAKRLHTLLTRVLGEYEQRYGKLDGEPGKEE